MDIVVLADHRMKMKENEKRDKSYLDLSRELKILGNMRVTVISVVFGAFETVNKLLKKWLEQLKVGGKIDFNHLVTVSTLLRSAIILRRVLDIWCDLLLHSARHRQLTLVRKTRKEQNYYYNNCKSPEDVRRLAVTQIPGCPVGWGCRIHRLLLCRGVGPLLPNECPGYDTKQSDGEVPAFGECGVLLHCHHSQVHSGLSGSTW